MGKVERASGAESVSHRLEFSLSPTDQNNNDEIQWLIEKLTIQFEQCQRHHDRSK